MKQRSHHIKTGIIILLIILISTGIGTALITHSNAQDLKGNTNQAEEASYAPSKSTDISSKDRINILLLGIDARNGEKWCRSDTMILASIDPRLKKAALIWIPRDTRIDVPGSKLDKINSASITGGPELAVKTVEKLMQVKIDNYVQVDFKGFTRLIDLLGGVDFDVPCDMYKPAEGINLHAGRQRLDGKAALSVVRFRGYPNADIGRAQQQQDFIKVLANEITKPDKIVKLPKILKESLQYVETDLKTGDIIRMASWISLFTGDAIASQTLPGIPYNTYNAQGQLMVSYWQPDTVKIPGLIDAMLDTSVTTGDKFKGNESSSFAENPKRSDKKIPILIYHEIGPGPNSLFVSKKLFAQQMQYLYQNGYRVVSVAHAQKLMQANEPVGKTVAISFDDGYKSVYTQAWPILKSYGFSATVFVITDFIGRENRLTWYEIKDMQSQGIEIGSHTQTHPSLLDVKSTDLNHEIAGSRQYLAQHGVTAQTFCYPGGHYDKAIVEQVRNAGYELAVTTKNGWASLETSPFELKRVFVSGYIKMNQFIQSV